MVGVVFKNQRAALIGCIPLLALIKVPDSLFPVAVDANAAPAVDAVNMQFIAVIVPAVVFTAG